ncbi:hypothetical protein PCC7424_2726 [Gloeothece citriformis PCC 7424]|uniref:PEP-CTERM protein-sorting domain-containing protein n=1 Tax=Gloeothece citriformis (strain PCC 7424) TaxID=65393 RepID=B7K7U2_GLOC7|nr:PEP-CTERM sorting domain-containing protein [Gloeothece citriformis]ACK71138.1 hypothetical protein PCC7424_2726 [Gloeothece citriformis PCC 7424]
MNKQLFTVLSALPLVGSAIVLNPLSAQAAQINPPTNGIFDFSDVYGISSINGATNGVRVRIVGNNVTFDFVPPSGSGNGIYNVDSVSGAFTDFGNPPFTTNREIKDFTTPLLSPGQSAALNIDNFLTLGDGNFFDLANLYAPTFNEQTLPSGVTSTTIRFIVDGTFQSSTGSDYAGLGIFTANFVGLNTQQVLARAASPNGILTPYSATFEAVPEPMTMLGVGTALGFGALFKRKNAKKENKG